jgi:chlorite dismutase
MTRIATFLASDADTASWRVREIRAIAGDSLPWTPFVAMISGEAATTAGWRLRGIASNERYVTRPEKERLVDVQQGLGRSASTLATLIPIRKTAAWWALTQDERRQILEVRSRHIATGLRYLPAIARKLFHCRDLGEDEPFDFLTWFEYAPADEPAFDDLLAALRATPEWTYVAREVEVRLERV